MGAEEGTSWSMKTKWQTAQQDPGRAAQQTSTLSPNSPTAVLVTTLCPLLINSGRSWGAEGTAELLRGNRDSPPCMQSKVERTATDWHFHMLVGVLDCMVLAQGRTSGECDFKGTCPATSKSQTPMSALKLTHLPMREGRDGEFPHFSYFIMV